MAEGETMTTVPKQGVPVKKRRFFKPRPKQAPEKASAQVGDQKPIEQQKSKPQQPPKQKTANAKQGPQATKPKQAPKPRMEQATKPKLEQTAKPKQVPAVKAEPQPKPKQAPKPKTKPQAEHRPKPKQLKPAAQTVARVVKTNSNFRQRKPNNSSRLSMKDISFEYLNTPEFADIYALVTKAQSYFETDKETCCAKFRIANEAIIARLVKTMQLEEAAEKNTFEQIDLLSKNIPVDMVNSNIFTEMHNIRMIGNSFVHNDDKYDPEKGAKTCTIAMGKICMWLVEFEPKYKSYQRAKAATRSTFDIIKDFVKGLFKF